LTFLATLWYAGAVVLQIGYDGQTPNDCQLLAKMMMVDIEQSYNDTTMIDDLAASMFPTNQFVATCETEIIETDQRYAK
jgi:hypothetical protein